MAEGYPAAGAFKGGCGGSGEQVGLVVRTIPTTTPMQRDRDEQADRVELGSADDQVGQERAEEAVELALVAELQSEDELAKRPIVFADAEGARYLGSAVLTTMAAAVDNGVTADAVAAGGAGGRLQVFLQSPPTVVAESVGTVRHRLRANRAGVGKKQLKGVVGEVDELVGHGQIVLANGARCKMMEKGRKVGVCLGCVCFGAAEMPATQEGTSARREKYLQSDRQFWYNDVRRICEGVR